METNRTPVICDRCRAEGIAGDPAFDGIPDLLAFTPVPVRRHANNWTAEHQRAFVAALALTGSVAQAARAVGRYAAGADRLRKAPGGRPFAEAWDAALDLARDRELANLHQHMKGLATDCEARTSAYLARPAPHPGGGAGPWGKHVAAIYGEDYDPDEYLEGHAQLVEARGRIRDRLLHARRLYLFGLLDDPAMRAAWEVLAGPVDWDKAERLEPQDNEPEYESCGAPRVPNLRGPDMLLTAEAGYLAEFAGGHDAMDALRAAVAEALREREAEGKPGDEE